jgi:hypothetical protein
MRGDRLVVGVVFRVKSGEHCTKDVGESEV